MPGPWQEATDTPEMRRIARFFIGFCLIAGVVVPAHATETRTWYVYCEGTRHGEHWAVFSENMWPHADTGRYGRAVASAAEAFIEREHNLPLQGCASVPFIDGVSAAHSRARTAKLHKRMGDKVYYVALPGRILAD